MAIAQLVERQIVVLDVAGSSPVSHPPKSLARNHCGRGFFYCFVGFRTRLFTAASFIRIC